MANQPKAPAGVKTPAGPTRIVIDGAAAAALLASGAPLPKITLHWRSAEPPAAKA